MFSPVSFNDPNSNTELTLKSPALFIYKPVAFPDPSVSCLSVADITALSMVFMRPK